MNIVPRQPYFVIAASRYYKAVIMNYGISHFYCFQKDSAVQSSVLAIPDGSIDILFCCDQAAPYAVVCGSVLAPTVPKTFGNGYFFGVRFFPGQNLMAKNCKMTEIIEHEIPLLEVLDAKELSEKITASRDFKEQIHVFMEYYLKLYASSLAFNPRANLKNYLLKRIIDTAGQIKVSDMAEETGYSVRYINMVFLEVFGLSPKVFCRIIRFQNLLGNLNELDPAVTDANLAQIATELGYYDQSHMIRDFYELSNTTPGKYLHFLAETGYKKRIILV